MGKRFAVIGLAAAGAMALGAQTAAAAPKVVKYGTKVTLTHESHAGDGEGLWHGGLKSKARKCVEGRRVVLLRQRPGPDRRLGSSDAMAGAFVWAWEVTAPMNGRVYAKAKETPVCRADRSRIIENGDLCPEDPAVISCPSQTATSSSGPVDSVPPDLQLSGPKKQNPQAGHVYVTVSCGDQACTTRATGRLTKVKEDKLGPVGRYLDPGDRGEEGRLGLKMPLKTRKQVRRALNEGKTVKAKVTVRAHDAAGNVAIAKRTIKLVK